MGSRLHSWINQPVQDSQLGNGNFFFQENVNNNSQCPLPSPLISLGNFSSPPPALITKLMPQPALNKFYASNVHLDKTSFAALSSRPIKTATFQKQPELPSLVSPSIELLPNEQLIWDVVFSKVQCAVENKQAAPELLEELKFIKKSGHSTLHDDLASTGLNFSENENNNNDHFGPRSSALEASNKSKPELLLPMRIDGHNLVGSQKSAQMHGREFPIQVLKLKCQPASQKPKCVKCEVSSGGSQSSIFKSSSVKASVATSSVGASSCSHSALDKKVSADSELSFGEKIVKVIDDFDSVSSNASVKSASLPSVVSSGSGKQIENGCSLCFGDYKSYCIQNNLPWPQQERFGHWHFHELSDGAGNVVCPKLQETICGLCFATGSKAHLVEKCPLLVMPVGEC
uniref:Nanos-type domain-containing protein n=1 Tax=Ditylenchus dipsaci TaxID=166011 RepID=A0A915EF43_9BILA